MKKFTYIFAAMSAAILFQACNKQSVEKDVITFSTSITKADLINSLDDLKEKGFSVWCAFSQNEKFTDTKMILEREKVSWSSWRWTYSNPIEWEHSGAYKFNALYPSDYAVASSGTKLVIDYDSEKESSDADLMLAYSFRKMSGQSSHTTVDLKFAHMLSAVKFVFKNSGALPEGYGMRFTNIGLSDIKTKGRINYVDGTPEWKAEADKDTVRYSAVAEEKWMSVLPQTLSSEANVFFTIEMGSDEYGWITTDASRILNKNGFNKWEMGKRYTYTVTVDTSCDINVEISVCDWDDVECETPEIIIR